MLNTIKKLLYAGLAIAILAAGFAGCRKEQGNDIVSSIPAESLIDVSGDTDVDFTVQSGWYWDWNNLHDYFECDERSGDASFNSANGETLKLFLNDGETEVTDWSTMIADGMVCVKYAADATVINRFKIGLSGDTSSVEGASATSEEASGLTASSEVSENTSSAAAVSGSVDSDSAPVKQTIKVLAFSDSSCADYAAEQFRKDNQDIRVSVEKANVDNNTNISNYLRARKASGTLPDVIFADSTVLGIAYSKGLVCPISDYVTEKIKNSFTPSCFDALTSGDNVYALPTDCATTCLVSNADIISTGNTGLPDSFEHLMTISSKIKADFSASGITAYGLSLDGSDKKSISDCFIQMLRSAGGSVLDGNSATFAGEAGTVAASSILKLERNGYISKDWTNTQLFNGKTAFTTVDCRNYNQLFGNEARLNFTASALPKLGGDNESSSLMTLNGCAMIAVDGRSDESAKNIFDFISRCCTDSDYQLKTAKQNSTVPSLLSAQKDDAFKSEEWQVYIDSLKNAECLPAVEGYKMIERYIAEAVVSAVNDTDTIQDALAGAALKANERLGRNAEN